METMHTMFLCMDARISLHKKEFMLGKVMHFIYNVIEYQCMKSLNLCIQQYILNWHLLVVSNDGN